MHKAGVTLVLDRAGVTGDDGPSHHGIWDLALGGIVPTLQIAAPRDSHTLREELREELHNTRGIPQEVDRQLLLGVRKVLERALSFQEKKMLREMVREKVLGPLANVEPASPAPAEHID